MIKRFLLAIFFIFTFIQASFAQEVFKITSVNFDTSKSMIFLTSPDNTAEAIMKNVKLTKLQNPKRAYFDINSAVLVQGGQNWFLNSGGVKQVKVAQQSTNPNKVRVVLYLEEDFNQSKISFLRVNNNIVIKFKDSGYSQDYFQKIYTDEKESSGKVYENLTISSQEPQAKPPAAVIPAKDEVLNQIQQAFVQNPAPTANSQSLKPVALKTQDATSKELKLKSKYYLDSITVKPDGFLVSGFGALGIEKPMYLANPARVVFDISNTVVNPKIKNLELKVNKGKDTLRVSQFDSSRARIVVESQELEKYFPVFSSDGQSIMFLCGGPDDTTTLFSKPNDAISYTVKKINPKKEEFIITFNSPVVHSIRRDSTQLTVNFYNTLRYNENDFKNTVGTTNFREMTIDLLPKIGLKMVLPLGKNSVINSYLGADGKSVKLSAEGLNVSKPIVCVNEKCIVLPKCNAKASVVIDAGHGGADYGAIRGGVNEKDINLDIAKRVQAILTAKGVSVAMTRGKDETLALKDRTDFCADINPDLFVSIHVNSSTKEGINGIETHYYHPNGIDFAQNLHATMISNIKANDRGLFKSKFYVINHTTVPAVLVEIGFISNASERAELVSEARKQQTAKAISEGILKYLNKK